MLLPAFTLQWGGSGGHARAGGFRHGHRFGGMAAARRSRRGRRDGGDRGRVQVVPPRTEEVQQRGLDEHFTQPHADEDADAGGQPHAEVLQQAQLRWRQGQEEVEHPRHHHGSPDHPSHAAPRLHRAVGLQRPPRRSRGLPAQAQVQRPHAGAGEEELGAMDRGRAQVVPLRPEEVCLSGLEEHIAQLRPHEDANAGGQPRAYEGTDAGDHHSQATPTLVRADALEATKTLLTG